MIVSISNIRIRTKNEKSFIAADKSVERETQKSRFIHYWPIKKNCI